MFRDIKAGDTVLVKSSLWVTTFKVETFWLPATVTRTTETQFLVGNDRHRKSNGSMVGGKPYDRCYLENEEHKDESEKYKKRKEDVENRYEITNHLSHIKEIDFLNHPHQHAVIALMKQILTLKPKEK